MEVIKTDSSTFRVVSSNGEEHWACCTICAMIEGIYYTNSEVHGECFSCGSEVVIVFREAELAWLDFSGNNEFVKVLFGGSCMKNKLTCSGSCTTSVRQTYDWASDLPTKSVQEQTYQDSRLKLCPNRNWNSIDWCCFTDVEKEVKWLTSASYWTLPNITNHRWRTALQNF
jgi:hypothetical protein